MTIKGGARCISVLVRRNMFHPLPSPPPSTRSAARPGGAVGPARAGRQTMFSVLFTPREGARGAFALRSRVATAFRAVSSRKSEEAMAST